MAINPDQAPKHVDVPDTMNYTDEERDLARSLQGKDRKPFYKRPLTIVGGALGAVSLAGVGFLALGGEKDAPAAAPTPEAKATSAPAVPGAAETDTPEAPAPVGETSAELEALAASVTPDKLVTMTPEELREAFTINIKDLDPANLQEDYVNRYIVLENARWNAGMTVEELADIPVNQPYTDFVEAKYYSATAEALAGNDALESTNVTNWRGAHARWNMAGEAGLYGTDITQMTPEQILQAKGEAAAAVYSLDISLKPGSVEVTKEGNAVDGPFTVKFTGIFDERYDNEALKAAGVTDVSDPAVSEGYFEVVSVSADADGNLIPMHTRTSSNLE